MNIAKKFKQTLTTLTFMGTALIFTGSVHAQAVGGNDPNVIVNQTTLGFKIPNFSVLLTFLIRFIFVIAGVIALVMMLWGALSWVTSGGDKGNVENARNKIVQAVVGILLIIVVVAVVATLEQVVFKNNLCFGLTCPVTITQILEAP
jgi:hypothetical protein